jgi:leucyl-tRNA synthetase/predicted alpha/beta hydrolase family esterase
MPKYQPKEIEPKIISKWKQQNIYKTPQINKDEKKYYSLYSFPYPSGAGLHVGHAEGMVANDIMARYYRMKGYKVLFPMGWDAFGLPAENFAIKTGTPPEVSTENAIVNFKKQIDKLGISVDWEKELGTHSPDYYRWTQWIFLELFKKGKAYRKNAPVNWCPSCQTVLANEQVIEGKCERCDTEVIQKEMEQWFFKITDYADRLDADLEGLDWPNGTKQQQRNWIGKSQGTRVQFFVQEVRNNIKLYETIVADQDSLQKLLEHNRILLDFENKYGVEASTTTLPLLETGDYLPTNDKELLTTHAKQIYEPCVNLSFEIFTTRIDTIYGATFCVLAPEHKLLESIKNKIANWADVEKYIIEAKNKTDLERQTQKDKTGVELKGVRALNPFNNELIPIFVADYVLGGYGTGAIMAVPAHDERDHEFAIKYNIPVKEVIAKEYGDRKDDSYESDGISAVVFNKDIGKYLILRRPTGMLTLISGRKEEGEAYEEALKRKLKQEAGITSFIEFHNVVPQFYSNYWHDVKKVQIRAKGSFYLVIIDNSAIDKETESRESHENFSLEWVNAHEMYQAIAEIGGNEHWLYAIKRAVTKNIELGYDELSNLENFKFDLVTEYGILFDSGEFSGIASSEAILRMQTWLQQKGLGSRETTYRLRDWLVSRQRYWGAPIPIIYSPKAKEEGYGYIPKESLNILVLHGLGSIGRKDWRIDLETEMTKLGHRVYLPDLPNSMIPDFEEWMDFIEKNYSDILKDGTKLVIVGHSLGGLLALKIAEKYKFAKVVAIAPAAPIEDKSVNTSVYSSEQIDSITKFFELTVQIDTELIRQNISEVIVINSKTDYLVRELAQNFWRNKLENIARFIDFEDKGHFCGRDLPEGFPELFPLINIQGNTLYPGIFPVYERDLPVLLPTDVDFKPTGESPIKLSNTFNEGVKCPIFGTEAYREADTMDTFVDSSWYFLRYTDVANQHNAFAVQKSLPAVYSEQNEKIWNLGKEIAGLLEIFDYGFIGSFGISILNGAPFRQITDIDLIISNDHLQTALEILKKNNFELVEIQKNTYSDNEDEKSYQLKKEDIEIELFNFEWKEKPKFYEKYIDGVKYKIEPVEKLKEHATKKNYTDVLEMVNSFENQTNRWLPADIYMIGAEHTVLHLLYSRFFTKFLHDSGYINFSEPFTKMRHMGLILGPDGKKMSKRWGNVINPIEEIEKYSADTLRMYEMFMGPYEEAKPWNDRAEHGVFRFLNRVSDLADKVSTDHVSQNQQIEINELIPKISRDIENQNYNTAVAKFMEFSNYLLKEEQIDKSVWEKFLKLMAPFAPFITDHLWSALGNSGSIHLQSWPEYEANLTKKSVIKIAVQVNGKVRGTLVLENELNAEDLVKLAKENEFISKHITGEIKKYVYVKARLLSLVI